MPYLFKMLIDVWTGMSQTCFRIPWGKKVDMTGETGSATTLIITEA